MRSWGEATDSMVGIGVAFGGEFGGTGGHASLDFRAFARLRLANTPYGETGSVGSVSAKGRELLAAAID